MLIKRFKQEEVQIQGQRENRVGLFEIFFNGECVYSRVRLEYIGIILLFLRFHLTFQRKSRAFPNFEAVITAAEKSLYDVKARIDVGNENERQLSTTEETKSDQRTDSVVKMYQVEKSDFCCTSRYQSCCYVS